MKIVVDTREQMPLRFTHAAVKQVVKSCLRVGDYGLALGNGKLLPVVFERKSVADLYGSLGKGYPRFKKELMRAARLKVQVIIIVEESLSSVLLGMSYSLRSPSSIVYQLFTLWVRYGVMTVFCGDRKEAARFITHFFIAHKQEYEKGGKKWRK